MKAISYLRFSTPEQKFGNSTERQLKTARDYCARNGLDLDEELSIADEGLSGYKGHHVERGSLGHFLNEVKAGKIPSGTALIVENLDRLSRQGIDATVDLLKQLTANGIDVHVVSISRVLKAGFNNSLTDYMLIGVQADLAHQESKKKSERISSAWASKRAKIASGVAYSGHVPAWLQVMDGKVVERPEIVAIVRRAFEMAAQGIGVVKIAQSIEVPAEYKQGRKKSLGSLTWYARLLGDRAVLGEFTPKDCETIPNFFPQVISQSEFDTVREVVGSKTKNGRVISGNKRNSDQADNLFSGLLCDVSLSDDSIPVRPMHFQKVQRGCYLMSAFSRDHKQNRIRYSVVESMLLQFIAEEDFQSVAGQSESDECKAARAELETLLREIDVTARRIKRDTAAMDSADMDVDTAKVFARRLAKDEAALETLKSRKDDLQANVERACRRCEVLYSPETMLDLISRNTTEATEVRLRLRSLIRQAIGRIGLVFDVPYEVPAGTIYMFVDYVNGVRHHALFNKSGEGKVLIVHGGPELAEEALRKLHKG